MATPSRPAETNLHRIHRRRSRDGIVFGDAHYDAGGACGPRVQSDIQLVVLVEGSAQVWVDGEARSIPAGHAALMRPGHLEHFLFSPTHPTRHTWLSLAPALLPADLQAALGGAPPVQSTGSRLDSLIELGLNAPEESTGYLASLGIAALWAYVSDAEQRSGRQRTHPGLRAAQRLIEERMDQDLDVGKLAEAACVTPQHLIRLFRQHLGTTPSRYLWQTRTRRGVDLLRETGLSVSEIADRVGFSSPFHFSRLVRQAFGASPRELRARSWAAVDAAKTELGP